MFYVIQLPLPLPVPVPVPVPVPISVMLDIICTLCTYPTSLTVT